MSTPTARQPKGIPVGGQFAATTHSDNVPSLAAPAPAADPLEALAAARLRIEGQTQYLTSQEAALKASADRVAGGSAAVVILEHYPTAAKVTYRRMLPSSTTFLALQDHDGNLLVDIERLYGWGRFDPAFDDERLCVRTATDLLHKVDPEAMARHGATVDGYKEFLDLKAAIASIPEALDQEPEPYTDPLTAHDRRALVDGAKEQFAKTAHSDVVPSLPVPAAADPFEALAAARQRIDAQRQYLKDQEAALKASADRIAGASAAVKLLEQYPTAAKITYRRDLMSFANFQSMHDHDGNSLVDVQKLYGWGRFDPAFDNERLCIRTATDLLHKVDPEAMARQGATVDGYIETLDLQTALASVPDALDVEPDPYTDPLTAHDRTMLVDAAKAGRASIGGILHGDAGRLDPEVEGELRYLAGHLDTMFGYDRQPVR